MSVGRGFESQRKSLDFSSLKNRAISALTYIETKYVCSYYQLVKYLKHVLRNDGQNTDNYVRHGSHNIDSSFMVSHWMVGALIL